MGCNGGGERGRVLVVIVVAVVTAIAVAVASGIGGIGRLNSLKVIIERYEYCYPFCCRGVIL